jgi:hypothetical protein
MDSERPGTTMSADHSTTELARRFYLEPAAAFVSSALPDAPGGTPEELVRLGLRTGLRLHRFKRTADLPPVRKVLGILRGLGPENVLDVGSGRGVFLWPLLDAFPWVPVTALDRSAQRVAHLQAVAAGGVARLRPLVTDVHQLGLADDCVDVARRWAVTGSPFWPRPTSVHWWSVCWTAGKCRTILRPTVSTGWLNSGSARSPPAILD